MTAGKGDDEGLGVKTLDRVTGSSIIIEAFNDVFGLGM